MIETGIHLTVMAWLSHCKTDISENTQIFKKNYLITLLALYAVNIAICYIFFSKIITPREAMIKNYVYLQVG